MGSTMQTASRAKRLRTKQSLAVAATGNHCPVSGAWVPEGTESPRQFFFERNIMPPVQESSVVWRLVEAEAPWHVLV